MANRYEEIGGRIRFARESAGFTQARVGARLGATGSTITNYEKGKRRVQIEDLERLSEILGRPTTWFLGYEESSPQREVASRLALLDRQLESIKNMLVELPQGIREEGAVYGDVPSDVVGAKNREEMIDRAFERLTHSGFPTALAVGLAYSEKLQIIRWYETVKNERLVPKDVE